MDDQELSEWTRSLLLANGIDNKVTLVRRVILDIGIEDAVKLYVELFADEETFKVTLPEFNKVEVVRADRDDGEACRQRRESAYREGCKGAEALDKHGGENPPEPVDAGIAALKILARTRADVDAKMPEPLQAEVDAKLPEPVDRRPEPTPRPPESPSHQPKSDPMDKLADALDVHNNRPIPTPRLLKPHLGPPT
jgi:hypothetical protein